MTTLNFSELELQTAHTSAGNQVWVLEEQSVLLTEPFCSLLLIVIWV